MTQNSDAATNIFFDVSFQAKIKKLIESKSSIFGKLDEENQTDYRIQFFEELAKFATESGLTDLPAGMSDSSEDLSIWSSIYENRVNQGIIGSPNIQSICKELDKKFIS